MRHVDKYLKMDDKFGDYAPYDVSPIDFVSLLLNAKYVLTDSFHGTIFYNARKTVYNFLQD